jgi:hypothetical protein
MTWRTSISKKYIPSSKCLRKTERCRYEVSSSLLLCAQEFDIVVTGDTMGSKVKATGSEIKAD